MTDLMVKLQEAGATGETARYLGATAGYEGIRTDNPKIKELAKLKREGIVVKVGYGGGKNTRYALKEIVDAEKAKKREEIRASADRNMRHILAFLATATPEQLHRLSTKCY